MDDQSKRPVANILTTDTQIDKSGDQSGTTGDIGAQCENNGDQSANTGEKDDQSGKIVDPSVKNGAIGDEIDVKSNISTDKGTKDNSIDQNAQTRKDQEGIGVIGKATLYWLDKMEDELSTDFHKAFVSNHKKEFEHHDITKVTTIQSCSYTTGKVIVVCRKVTCRLEQILDYFLEDVDGCLFDRILLIIIHNTDLGEIPQVPSKTKVAKLEPYKELNYIIDVSYRRHSMNNGFSLWNETEILFCKEALENFLQNNEENIDSSKKKTCVIF